MVILYSWIFHIKLDSLNKQYLNQTVFVIKLYLSITSDIRKKSLEFI